MQAINHTVQTLTERFVKKFDNERVTAEVRRKFHDGIYTKELVVGEVRLRGQDVLLEFTAECKKFEIDVIPISRIFAEVVPTLGGHTKHNPIIKQLSLLKNSYDN